jgi:hypothetical protein
MKSAPLGGLDGHLWPLTVEECHVNDKQQFEEPIHRVSAALACTRRIRALAGEAAGCRLGQEACRHLERIARGFGDRGGFSEEFLDELRAIIAQFEAWISDGTNVGFETYDAWDERGAETTAVHSIRRMTTEAQRLTGVVAELRQLAGLIEGTLDLVAAEAIVAALRCGSR